MVAAAHVVAVAERRGCDAAPIDPAVEEDRLRLLSYVWPDQRARFERLAGALEVARRASAVAVDAADACDWLEARLAEPADGVATVVFHSIFMQYLSDRGSRSTAWRRSRRRAGADRHARPWPGCGWSPAATQAEVRLTSWPGGAERCSPPPASTVSPCAG